MTGEWAGKGSVERIDAKCWRVNLFYILILACVLWAQICTHIVRWCGWKHLDMYAYMNYKQPFDFWSLLQLDLKTLAYLTSLLEHTMTSCPLTPTPVFIPFSLGPLTGCFVPWQIYSSWLPYRALGKWDTNATVSAVSLAKTNAVACGNKTEADTTMVRIKQHNTW